MQLDLKNTMKIPLSKRFPRAKVIAFIILTIISVIWLFPIVWMIGTSIKTDIEIMTNPTSILPTMGYDFSRYLNFFDQSLKDVPGSNYVPIISWFGNSIFISLFSALLAIIIQSLAAYAFTFLDFKRKSIIWVILIGSMTIPSIATYVAGFAIKTEIGKMFDFSRAYIYVQLIMPSAGGIFGLFLLRQFMLSIPKDLVESARMDGSSNIKIFRKIISPVLKNALFVNFMLVFIASWNSYEGPALLFSLAPNKELAESWKTLAVGLTDWAASAAVSGGGMGGSDSAGGIAGSGRMMAASTISMLPVMLVYSFFSNKIIDGFSTSGIKG